MGSVIILVLQVVCLVCVLVAIVYTRRALGSMKEANENMEKTARYTQGVRAGMEERFKKIEDTISALRRGAKKKGK